jgi:hypothetical protein
MPRSVQRVGEAPAKKVCGSLCDPRAISKCTQGPGPRSPLRPLGSTCVRRPRTAVPRQPVPPLERRAVRRGP